jgi:hypothetical protein
MAWRRPFQLCRPKKFMSRCACASEKIQDNRDRSRWIEKAARLRPAKTSGLTVSTAAFAAVALPGRLRTLQNCPASLAKPNWSDLRLIGLRCSSAIQPEVRAAGVVPSATLRGQSFCLVFFDMARFVLRERRPRSYRLPLAAAPFSSNS